MKDESKRWIQLIACMVMNCCIGSAYAWSVFQKPLIQIFNWTPTQVALPFSLVMAISAIPMVFVGMAQKYVPSKTVIFIGGLLFGLSNFFTGYIQTISQLYIIYGVFAGIGLGVVYSGGVANMVRFFPDQRGLCSGLLAAGMGSGALIIAPIAGKIIDIYGVLDAFKILGAIYTVIICSLALLIETASTGFKPEGRVMPGENAVATVSGEEKDWRQMLQDPIFYVIAAMFGTGTTSGLMIIGHASPILQEVLKLTPQRAAALVGIVALANAAGRVFWGYISDRLGRFPTIMLMYCISAVSMFGLTVVSPNTTFIGIMLVVSTCYGGFMAMIASLTADTFGVKNFPINFGIMFMSFAIAAYYGPRLAATVKMANNGDYSQAFLTAAGLSLVGIVLARAAMYIKKKRARAIDIRQLSSI